MKRFLSQTAVAALGAAALIAVAAEPEVLTPGTVAVQIAEALGAAGQLLILLCQAALERRDQKREEERRGADRGGASGPDAGGPTPPCA